MERLPTQTNSPPRQRWRQAPALAVRVAMRWARRISLGARATPGMIRALPEGRPWFAIRARLLLPDSCDWLLRRSLAQRIMDNHITPSDGPTQTDGQSNRQTTALTQPELSADGAPSQGVAQAAIATEAQQPGQPASAAPHVRHVLLVRHGQTQYNVEGRLPGQLPGVSLTDEGRRQAHQAAVALSGLPLSAIIASPLERARDTAEIIARGWALPVRTDARLMDTDVGSWAGQTINEVAKNDPRWKQFVEHPTEPPSDVESLTAVQERSVATVEDTLNDPTTGDYIVIVAHADVVKLIIMRYTHVPIDGIRFVSIANASISVLAFSEGARTEAASGSDTPGQNGSAAEALAKPADVARSQPTLLAVNWTSLPRWLSPPPKPKTPDEAPAAANGLTQVSQAQADVASGNPSGDTEGYLLPEPR